MVIHFYFFLMLLIIIFSQDFYKVVIKKKYNLNIIKEFTINYYTFFGPHVCNWLFFNKTR